MAVSVSESQPQLGWKLWIYTNYDCNLSCSYCVARSSPRAPRRAFGLANTRRLVDEAVDLAVGQIFFTGGEPFLLNDIYDLLAYSSARVKTTVLTNAMLFQQQLPGSRQTRLDRLAEIANEQLIVQVSLDGGRAEHHDAYRGAGTWEKTVAGIQLLQERGFRVRLGSTETPANSAYLSEICDFHRTRGIPDEDHFIRPLAKRGYSQEGLELTRANLLPELTVDIDGAYWHPLSTDADMKVCDAPVSLGPALARLQVLLAEAQSAQVEAAQAFT